MRKTAADLRVGDPIFTRDGRVCGTVTHVQSGTVYLDLGFHRPTVISGPALHHAGAKLGNLHIFYSLEETGHGNGRQRDDARRDRTGTRRDR